MGSLPPDLRQALTTAARVTRLLITSDFDGTLAPIVSHPADARPLPRAADAFRTLAGLPSTTTALISGRSVHDLAVLSGLGGEAVLVGSHGAEFDTGFAHEIDELLLERMRTTLDDIVSRHPGATVETKPASVALHVRNASTTDAERALAEAWRASGDWDAHITEGKAVLEFAVIDTDKGEAIDILRERTSASMVVYFGDDVTDEKAFRRLRGEDIGVKVGPGDTLARYRVDSPEDVGEALDFVYRQRSGAH
ncbi:trehalose-phosphatase [Mycolicibacterium palauense]|uniref:trehalose-phosphatase n=1 Tax=Mycolicibacterium palauense TaxID=2034511 RepID=UPI001FEA6027|nr:trehalose-phosphatase [Mycolicibacterium palauense]